LIKSFASEDRTQSRLVSELNKAFQITLEQTTVKLGGGRGDQPPAAVSRGVALALGAFGSSRKSGPWAPYSPSRVPGLCLRSCQFLAAANLQLQKVLAALQRIWALFRILPEENSKTGEEVDHLKGGIEFREVSFSYDGREQVFERLSFEIQRANTCLGGPERRRENNAPESCPLLLQSLHQVRFILTEGLPPV